MKLQKMLFFAQAIYLALYENPLFEDDFEAWSYGPVNRNLYYEYKQFGNASIKMFVDKPKLSQESEIYLSQFANIFLPRDPFILSALTHKPGTPWDVVRDGLPSGIPCSNTIPKSLIKNYYEDLLNDTEENDGEDVVLSEFLDFLVEDAKNNFDKLIPYTEDMLQEDKYLLDGVVDL